MPKLNAETFTGPMFLFGASLIAMGSMIAVVVQSPGSANDKARVGLPAPLTTLVGQTTTSATVPPDITPPPIFVASGLDGSSVTATPATISGTTEPGAILTIDGKPVNVDPTGAWSTTVTVTLGANTIAVVAADAAGNTSTKTIVISYVPEASTTTVPATSSTVATTSTTAHTTTKPTTKPTLPPTTTPTTAGTTTLPPDTVP